MEFEGAEYMVHADIDDVDQTVAVVDIATQARDGITNTGEGTCTENGVLIDTVAYTGLTPGKEYRIFTTLMDKASDIALTGEDGLPRVGMTTFTPDTPDGTIDITVALDTRELAGKSVVFFEKLADADENVIAVHEDIDDEGQTVTFPEEVPEPEVPGKGYPKTGGFADVDPGGSEPARNRHLRVCRCGICLHSPLPQHSNGHRRARKGGRRERGRILARS